MPYYTPTDIPAFGRARSDTLDQNFNDIKAAFDSLPTAVELKNYTGNFGTDTGAANAYVVTLPYTPTAYADGQEIVFVPANNNTGDSTVNVNSLGVKGIVRQDETALQANDIAGIVTLRYNATLDKFMTMSAIQGQTLSALMASLNAVADASAFLTTLGVSTYAKTILDDATAKAAKDTLQIQVDGLTELRGLTPVDGEILYLKYHTTQGDGGHGVFEALTTGGPYTDDNGVTIVPTDGDGSSCWRRKLDGYFTLEDFGRDIQAAINASAQYHLECRASADEYTFSDTLIMKEGAVIVGPECNNLSVLTLATAAESLSAKFVCTAIAVDAVTFDSDQYNAGFRNIAFDLSAQTAGDGIVFDDTAGALRPGQFLKNCLVYNSSGKLVWIKANNKEVYLDTVYARGGVSRATARSTYGIYYEGVDSRFFNVEASACKTRCIYSAGGAVRWRDVDAWDSQDINVEVTGTSSYWSRLQVDGAGESGLLINGATESHFERFTSINNGVTAATPVADVRVTGDSRGVTFVDPIMRGTAGNIDYAFSEEGTNVVQVIGGRVATSYTDMLDATAEAYWDVVGANFSTYATRRFLVSPTDHNQDNPFFTTYTAGTPDGWSLRNSATAAQITTGLPHADFTSGVRVTSSATGVSGIQIDLSSVIAKYLGQKIKITGLFKGDGAAYLGQQEIRIFDDIASTNEVIPNDATWGKRAVVHTVDASATTLQIRIIAATDAVAGKALDATAVKVESY